MKGFLIFILLFRRVGMKIKRQTFSVDRLELGSSFHIIAKRLIVKSIIDNIHTNPYKNPPMISKQAASSYRIEVNINIY